MIMPAVGVIIQVAVEDVGHVHCLKLHTTPRREVRNSGH